MGKITLKINGLNLNKFVDGLLAGKVELTNMERTAYDELYFEAKTKNMKKINALAKQMNLNISIIAESGVSSVLMAFLRRLGLVFGVIAVTLCSIFLTNSCFKINIEVDGVSENAGAIKEEILRVLKEHNIAVGAKISGLNTRMIEKEILKGVNNVALAVVNKDGVVLNIFIKEATAPEVTTKRNIVASESGVIESINLVSGNLLVNIGDSVTKGQVLIECGNVGDVFAEANGTITAKVLISGDSVGTLERVHYKRSGKFVEVRYIELFGKLIKASKITEEQAKQLGNFEIEKEERQVSCNNIIPIKKISYRYYELIEEFTKMEYTNLIEELKESAYNVAKNKLPANAPEISVEYKTIETEEYIKVVCNIETSLDIAIREK